MAQNPEVKYKVGETLFQENAPAVYLYIIREGQVKISKKGNDGTEMPVALIGSGEFLGELSLLHGSPHSTTGTAVTPVTAIKISKEMFEGEINKTTSWIVAMIKGLAMRLGSANDILKRNSWVDEQMQEKLEAIEQKFGTGRKKRTKDDDSDQKAS